MILSLRHLFLCALTAFTVHAQESFLVKHNRDAIKWQPYTQETLRRAQSLKKPIWVYVGFFGCQWCTVMTKESYQDIKLAHEIEQFVIPVIVDKYLEPVLDAQWQDWALRHNGATGWPLNLILTPQGVPFAASNYLRPQELLQFVKHGSQLWQARPNEALRRSKQVVDLDRLAGASVKVDESGYLVTGPLFYHLLNLEKRMSEEELKNSSSRELVTKILENLLQSRLWDVVESGFHRYSSDRYGLSPHFEKMLQDNARLMAVYRRAGVVLKRDEFLAAAELIEVMLDKKFKLKPSVYANAQAAQERAYQREKKCNQVSGLSEIELSGGGVGIKIDSLAWLRNPVTPDCWKQWRASFEIPVDPAALLYPNIIFWGAKLDRVMISGDAALWKQWRTEWVAFRNEFKAGQSWRRVWGEGAQELTEEDKAALVWIYARVAAAFGERSDEAEWQRLAKLYPSRASSLAPAHEPSWRSARELLDEVRTLGLQEREKIYVISSEAQRAQVVAELLKNDPHQWFKLRMLTEAQLKERSLHPNQIIEKIKP